MKSLSELEEHRRQMRSKSVSARYFHGVIFESDFCTNHAQKHNTPSGGSSIASRITSDFNFNFHLARNKNVTSKSGDTCVQQ